MESVWQTRELVCAKLLPLAVQRANYTANKVEYKIAENVFSCKAQ